MNQRPALRGPKHPARVAAYRAMVRGDYTAAARQAHLHLRAHPDDAEMLRVVGLSASNMQHPQHAIAALQRAAELEPNDAVILASLASVLHHAGEDDTALQTLRRALELDASDPVVCSIGAQIHRAAGDPAAARAVLAPALRAPEPDPSVLVLAADLADASGRTGTIAQLETCLRRDDINAVFREQLHNRLAKLYDREGRTDDAWGQLERQHAAADHPPRATDADAVIRLWDRDACAALPRASRSGAQRVLIVGMPRSGTTLTESILDAHPHAGGIGESPMLTHCSARIHAGERTQAAIDAMAEAYHAAAERLTGGARVIADKMPGNINLLHAAAAVLPACRVVRCRRDPRDVLLSCLFQNFHNRNTFVKDPVVCARQIVATERLDAHWRDVLDLDVLDMEYAQSVSDLGTAARRLVDHAGLGWDDACMRFHERSTSVRTASVEQVRKPIYTSSVGKWTRYEHHLAPAIDVLRDAGLLDAYE